MIKNELRIYLYWYIYYLFIDKYFYNISIFSIIGILLIYLVYLRIFLTFSNN